MALLKNKNFAFSTLAEDLTDSETDADVAAGEGALFPASGSFMAVIWSASYPSPTMDATREIVLVSSVSTDTLTIDRAEEGTAAKAWSTGDNIAHVITAGKLDQVENNMGLQNLITNSGFGVWSNSTLENVRALPDATSVVTGTSVASDAHALTAGMLVKDAAGTPLVFEVISISDANTFVVDRAGGTNGQWYEVTPGCVAANVLAVDGWSKGSATDIWREHAGSNTKAGSYYSCKITGTSAFDLYWPLNGTAPIVLAKMAGRTATMGAWVKSDAANQVRIAIYNGASITYSEYNSGTDFEWLEHTFSVSSAPNAINFGFYVLDTKTAYVSQPMLVFGSYIGSGNYQPIVGEVVNVENTIAANPYVANTNQIINLEAQSSGKIPKGAGGIFYSLRGTDTGAGNTITVTKDATTASSNLAAYSMSCGAVLFFAFEYGYCPCDVNGDVYINHSGGTWSGELLRVRAIQWG